MSARISGLRRLPQACVQLSFPTLAETIAENITASGVLNTNTSGGSSSPQPTTTTTTGTLASLDIAPQGSSVCQLISGNS